MPSSGATNRQKAREAEAGRRAEQTHAPRRLANLSDEEATVTRILMNELLAGVLVDPDAVPVESEEHDAP